jgi:uncharacterized protein YkwD
VQRLAILLTATLSLVGGTALTSSQTALAHAPRHAPRAHVADPRARHAVRTARSQREQAQTGCRHRPGGICNDSAPNPRRSAAGRHRPSGASDALKAVSKAIPANPAALAGRARAGEIAAVLATSCENTQLMPEPGNLGLVRAAVLCLVNKERAQNGVAPLRTNNLLEQAAEGHSRELISADYFAHVSPSGETPVDRVRQTGYIPGPSVGYVIGENLAWGTYSLATPAAIVSAWIASPGHLANILESQYTETGIGVVPQVPSALGNGSPGASYAQEFGVIIH